MLKKIFILVFVVFIGSVYAQPQAIPHLSDTQRKLLFNPGGNAILGNPKGDVTIVEFFDYQCPYCHKITPKLIQLAKDDPNVRIIFKEFLLFGPVSEIATRAALAANLQGKYLPLHDKLMTMQLPLDYNGIMWAAKSVGLDTEKLKKDMNSKAVNDQIRQNNQLAHQLGIFAAPFFVIANSSIIGNPPNLKAKKYSFLGEVSEGRLENYISKARE